MKRIPRNQRVDEILIAASEIAYKTGIESLTMREIATNCGISRQALYQYFHNTEEVLEALFERTFHDVLDQMPPLEQFQGTFVDRVMSRANYFLTMPVPLHQLIMSAVFSSPHDHPAQLALKERLAELIERNWIAPLASLGINDEVALSGLYAMFGAMLQYRDLIEQDRISLDTARLQLDRMARELIRNHDDCTEGPRSRPTVTIGGP